MTLWGLLLLLWLCCGCRSCLQRIDRLSNEMPMPTVIVVGSALVPHDLFPVVLDPNPFLALPRLKHCWLVRVVFDSSIVYIAAKFV